MDLQIRGNDIAVTDQIRAVANRHATRLERLVDAVDDAKLELRKESQRAGGEVAVAQLTLHTGRSLLRAEERDRDASKAVDSAFAKLEVQLRRLHERKADRRGPRASIQDVPVAVDGSEADDEPTAVVRTKRFPVKPMDSDEAIEHMELLGHDFYLFDNIDAKVISVVYKRRDGSYGLLVPEPM